MIASSSEYVRTEEELQQAAQAQFRALKISADHFDLGEMGEAARMANALFILVGEGMQTHTSIFDAAGQKGKRLYRSTKKTNDDLGCSLVFLELKKVGVDTWEAQLRHAGRTALEQGRDVAFSDWWNERVIANDAMKVSRAEIVRILRNKNGGAHFDPVITDPLRVAAIRGEIGLFNIQRPDGTLETVPFGLEYCMRQIATEFWYSTDENKAFDVPYQNHCERPGATSDATAQLRNSDIPITAG